MSRGHAWALLREQTATLADIAQAIREERLDLQLRPRRRGLGDSHADAELELTAVEAILRSAAALQAFAQATAEERWPTALEMDRAIVTYRERGDHTGVRLVSALRRLTSVMAEATVRALPPAEETADAP